MERGTFISTCTRAGAHAHVSRSYLEADRVPLHSSRFRMIAEFEAEPATPGEAPEVNRARSALKEVLRKHKLRLINYTDSISCPVAFPPAKRKPRKAMKEAASE